MNNSNGLTKEQEGIARRATNLENLEYIKKIEKAMDDGEQVEVDVIESNTVTRYQFFVG